MRTSLRVLSAAVVSMIIGASPVAQQRGVAPQDPQVRATLERQRPGELHKKLNVLVGRWTTSWTVWQGPEQPPSDQARGTAVLRSVLGGRFIEGVYTGSGILGTTFEGRLFLGYDAPKGQYTATWLNSFETELTTFAGSPPADLADRPLLELTLRGRPSPHTKIGTGESRVAFSFPEANRVIEQQFDVDPARKEFKAVEVIYTRSR